MGGLDWLREPTSRWRRLKGRYPWLRDIVTVAGCIVAVGLTALFVLFVAGCLSGCTLLDVKLPSGQGGGSGGGTPAPSPEDLGWWVYALGASGAAATGVAGWMMRSRKNK